MRLSSQNVLFVSQEEGEGEGEGEGDVDIDESLKKNKYQGYIIR